MAATHRITLPVGTARYPALHRPDTKFQPDGVYKANIAVPRKEAEATIQKLQALAKEYLGKALPKSDNGLWKLEVDDNGDETDFVMFKAAVKNFRDKNTGELVDRRPKQVDANLNPCNEVVYGGSELRVACNVRTWEYNGKKGMSLQPYTVQILKLVGPDSLGDNPFDVVEGGFIAPDVPDMTSYDTMEPSADDGSDLDSLVDDF